MPSDAGLQVRIYGLEELERAMRKAPELVHREMHRAMTKSTMVVEEKTKRETPVDTGRLRASWNSRVEGFGTDIRGVVGTKVFYAPYVEYGTRPHWPPPGALATWAKRHGIPEFVVARTIAARGTKGRKMLTTALEESIRKIEALFSKAIDRVLEAL